MLKRRAGRAPHARATPARPSCPSAPHLRPLSAAHTLIRRRYSSRGDSVGWPARCGAVSRPPSARGDRARSERRCSWLAAGSAAQPPCHAQVRRSRRRAAAGQATHGPKLPAGVFTSGWDSVPSPSLRQGTQSPVLSSPSLRLGPSPQSRPPAGGSVPSPSQSRPPAGDLVPSPSQSRPTAGTQTPVPSPNVPKSGEYSNQIHMISTKYWALVPHHPPRHSEDQVLGPGRPPPTSPLRNEELLPTPNPCPRCCPLPHRPPRRPPRPPRALCPRALARYRTSAGRPSRSPRWTASSTAVSI